MKYSVDDRIRTKDGEIATVRFVGILPEVWDNDPVLGVEWDHAKRGKNSGEHNGVSYFQTRKPGSGSFIKYHSPKICDRTTFAEALVSKYGTTLVSNDAIEFGTKTVENFGMDKLGQYNAHFETLETISLAGTNIALPFAKGDKDVVSRLKSLKCLDLSLTLVSRIELIWEIVDSIPTLEELVLGGNQFFDYKNITTGPPHPNVISLKLPQTNFLYEKITALLVKFPNLQDLSLAENGYSDLDICEVNMRGLRKLDLSFNCVTTFPKCPVTSINLEGNSIRTFDVTQIECTTLDLRGNDITEWEFIDKLAAASRLHELRINRNPLFENLSVDDMTFGTIARFQCGPQGLRSFNGLPLKPAEIVEAEIYFVSQVSSGRARIDQESPRWRELAAKYQRRQVVTIPMQSSELVQKRIQLQICHRDEVTSRAFLTDNSVLRLKGVASRVCQASVLDFDLYYYIDGLESNNKEYLDDDTSLLDRFKFVQNQKIFISFHTLNGVPASGDTTIR